MKSILIAQKCLKALNDEWWPFLRYKVANNFFIWAKVIRQSLSLSTERNASLTSILLSMLIFDRTKQLTLEIPLIDRFIDNLCSWPKKTLWENLHNLLRWTDSKNSYNLISQQKYEEISKTFLTSLNGHVYISDVQAW